MSFDVPIINLSVVTTIFLESFKNTVSSYAKPLTFKVVLVLANFKELTLHNLGFYLYLLYVKL